MLPTPIPDKGAVLTQLSLWWFDQLADLVPNHVISATDVPPEFAGRAMRCRRLEMLPVECIARGYLAGLAASRSTRRPAPCPAWRCRPGWSRARGCPSRSSPRPRRRRSGEHDESITFAEVEDLVGAETAARLRDLTLAVYPRGAETAARERDPRRRHQAGVRPRPGDGEIVLADEVLTPDSSRFWPADRWAPGRPQSSFDKQFVRDWSATLDWDRTPPGPEIPPRSSTPPAPATSRSTSASPACPGPPDHPVTRHVGQPEFAVRADSSGKRHASLTSSRAVVAAPRLQWTRGCTRPSPSVTADDSADVVSFADSVAERGVPLSLLVLRVGPEGRRKLASRLVGWLRERQAGGDVLVLHGDDHSRRPLGPQRRIRRA